MEAVGVQFFFRLGKAAEVVQERDLFEDEVIAAFHLCPVGLQAVEAFLCRVAELLVELVEFHQDAGVGLVEGPGALHGREGAGGVVAFVVADEGEAAPGGREVRVGGNGLLPALFCEVVLAFVVPEVAEEPGCPRVIFPGRGEYFDCLQSIRETGSGNAGRLARLAAAERSGGAIIFPIIKRHLRERITL